MRFDSIIPSIEAKKYDALHEAIHQNDITKVVELSKTLSLSKKIYYITELDVKGTPLHLATYIGKVEVVNTLLLCGAKIDDGTEESESTLQAGARFLTFGFWQRSGNYTPLAIAGIRNHTDLIQSLLTYGANYKVKDRRKNLPLSIEQLCNNFPNNGEELDLRIYPQSFRNECLMPVKNALRRGKIKKLYLGSIPYLNLGDEKSNFSLFYNALELIKINPHLETFILDTRFVIKTRTDIISDASEYLLTNCRKNLVKILNAILETVKNSRLHTIDLGKFEHIHTTITKTIKYKDKLEHDYNMYSRRYELMRKSEEVEVTETKENHQIVFCINNDAILNTGSFPDNRKSILDQVHSERISESGAIGIVAIVKQIAFDVPLSTVKLFDTEIITAFFSKMNEILISNKTVPISSSLSSSSSSSSSSFSSSLS